MAFVVLFLGAAGLAFWYGTNKYAAIDTGRRVFYTIGIAGVICVIAMVVEMIKAGSF